MITGYSNVLHLAAIYAGDRTFVRSIQLFVPASSSDLIRDSIPFNWLIPYNVFGYNQISNQDAIPNYLFMVCRKAGDRYEYCL